MDITQALIGGITALWLAVLGLVGYARHQFGERLADQRQHYDARLKSLAEHYELRLADQDRENAAMQARIERFERREEQAIETMSRQAETMRSGLEAMTKQNELNEEVLKKLTARERARPR